VGSIPDDVIRFFFFNLHDPSSLTIDLGLTQPLTEMSTKNLPRDKSWPARKAGNLDVSHPHGSPGPAIGTFFFFGMIFVFSPRYSTNTSWLKSNL
jgi:hypothetical protein